MSWEDEVVRNMNTGSQGSGPDRRGHVVKMAVAGGLMAVCFGLFATGLLGARKIAPPQKTKDKAEAAKKLAATTGPEMGALILGSVSGVWFLFLLMRLRRFD